MASVPFLPVDLILRDRPELELPRPVSNIPTWQRHARVTTYLPSPPLDMPGDRHTVSESPSLPVLDIQWQYGGAYSQTHLERPPSWIVVLVVVSGILCGRRSNFVPGDDGVTS